MAQEMLRQAPCCQRCLMLFDSNAALVRHLTEKCCGDTFSDEKISFSFTLTLTLCYKCVSDLRFLSANKPTEDSSYVIASLCPFCRNNNRTIPPLLQNETQWTIEAYLLRWWSGSRSYRQPSVYCSPRREQKCHLRWCCRLVASSAIVSTSPPSAETDSLP